MNEELEASEHAERARTIIPKLAAVVLALLALIAYRGSFAVPFLLDGERGIEQNTSIHAFGTAFAPPLDTTVSGRPILNLSLAFNYALGQLEPFGYHAFNLGVHILSAWLLFGLLGRCLALGNARQSAARSGLAFCIATLWVLHPLQVQSVTYVMQRAESLMSCLLLATLYCSLRGFQSARTIGWWTLAMIACGLGMGVKETMVVAPLLVLLLDSAFISGGLGRAIKRHTGLYFGLALTWSILVMNLTGNRTGTAGLGLGVSPWDYLMTQSEVIAGYLRLALWPRPLVFYYEYPIAHSFGQVLVPFAIIALLCASAVLLYRRKPKLGFVCVSFFVVLGPTSSVLPIVTEVAAEHRMYLPLIAPLTLIVLALHSSLETLPRAALRGAGVTLLAIAGGFLMLETIQRNETFATAESIWRDVVAKRPEATRAHNNLAVELTKQGRTEAALEEYARAAELGDDFQVFYNMGGAQLELGRYAEAALSFEHALAIDATSTAAREYLEQARSELATSEPTQSAAAGAVPSISEDMLERLNRAAALLAEGEQEEAYAIWRGVIAEDPNNIDAHYSMGVGLLTSGRIAAALPHLERAAEIRPDVAETHRQYGVALFSAGRKREGIAEWREVIRISDDINVMHNLARILATDPEASIRSGVDAVRMAQRVVEVRSADPIALDTLACAFAEAGRFDAAVESAERALEYAGDGAKAALSEQIRAHIELFKQGQAMPTQ